METKASARERAYEKLSLMFTKRDVVTVTQRILICYENLCHGFCSLFTPNPKK